MKNLKSILCLIVVFCISFSMFGCAENNKKDSKENGVSASQLKEDIKKSDFIQNCYSSDFVYESEYSYISHDIIKRQTNIEEKEDIIYCNVTAQNKYFSVDFDVTLEYIYYDEGGWILEKSDITKKTPTPIAAAEKDLIVEHIFSTDNKIAYVAWYKNAPNYTPTLQNAYMGEVDVENGNAFIPANRSYYSFGTPTFDNENLCTLIPTNYCIGEIVKTEGNFRLFFDKEQGWTFLNLVAGETDSGRDYYRVTPVFEINSAQFDYSSTLGDFGRKDYSGNFQTEYSIKRVDIESERIYYSRKVYYPESMLDEYAQINLLTTELIGKDFCYNIENDYWGSRPHSYFNYVYSRIK